MLEILGDRFAGIATGQIIVFGLILMSMVSFTVLICDSLSHFILRWRALELAKTPGCEVLIEGGNIRVRSDAVGKG